MENVNPIENQLKALKTEIDIKLYRFRHNGSTNKIGATVVQLFIIGFSVTTPILIGWETTNPVVKQNFMNLALIGSAVTAAGNLLFNFFDYKDMWAHNKIGANHLRTLRAELNILESKGSENIGQEKIDELFKKFVTICEDYAKIYKETRLAKDPNTP